MTTEPRSACTTAQTSSTRRPARHACSSSATSMLDRYWFGAVERISPEAPVPVVRVNRARKERLGGAANVALQRQGARRAGEPADRGRRRRAGRRLEQLLETTASRRCFKRDPQPTPSSSCASSAARSSCCASTSRTSPTTRSWATCWPHYESAAGRARRRAVLRLRQGRPDPHPDDDRAARAAGKPVLVDPKGDDYSRYARRDA